VVRFEDAVKKATGLPIRNVEYSTETKLIRVNAGIAIRDAVGVAYEENSEALRKLL
jgi:hypothetical protein